MKDKSIFWWVFLAFAIPCIIQHVLYAVLGFNYRVFIGKFNILYFFIDLGVGVVLYGTAFYFTIEHFRKKYDDTEKKK